MTTARDEHHLSRHLLPSHGTFGADRFGVLAERFARFFGTPRFIIGQTIFVIVWIALNVVAIELRWDPYPFILLNLAFSTQAAYAAPLILLAQTRQAERDKVTAETFEAHRDAVADKQLSHERRIEVTIGLERKAVAQLADLQRQMDELRTALRANR